jgi:integrase
LTSGAWRARWVDGTGHRRSATFGPGRAGEEEAAEFLRKIHAQLTLGTYEPPVTRLGPTLDDIAEQWLGRPGIRDTTRALHTHSYNKWVRPFLGRRRVADLAPPDIRAWHATVASRTGPTATATAYRCLQGALGLAVEDGIIDRSPARLRGVAFPPRASEKRVLSAADVRAVAEAIAPQHRALFLVLATTGLRYGEAAGLKVGDVDGTALHVRRTVVRAPGGWAEHPPKTAAARRTVAMPPTVAAAVVELAARHNRGSSGWLFGAGAQPLSLTSFTSAFRRAMDRAGVERARVHDLRHTALTLAAQQGATVAELQARAGHTTVHMAAKYQFAAAERDAALAERLDVLLRA